MANPHLVQQNRGDAAFVWSRMMVLKAIGDRYSGFFGVDEKKAKRGQLGWFVFIALICFPRCILCQVLIIFCFVGQN